MNRYIAQVGDYSDEIEENFNDIFIVDAIDEKEAQLKVVCYINDEQLPDYASIEDFLSYWDTRSVKVTLLTDVEVIQ